jgi:hypothetical protein
MIVDVMTDNRNRTAGPYALVPRPFTGH